MILYVSGATATLARLRQSRHLGVLVVPRAMGAIRLGLPTAADNGAFSKFEPELYVRMLDKLAGRPVAWVTSPDAWGDARHTRELFSEWAPEIAARDLPIAYVIQDGQRVEDVPWDRIAAIFIGGTDPFRYGDGLREIVAQAKRLGKLIHLGRVNTKTRIRWAQSLGCDSVDGSSFSRFPDAHIPWALGMLECEQLQLEGF